MSSKKKEGFKLFLLILPFLILCFLFSYYPLHGWIYALYDYKAPLKLSQCDFVGLKWFKTLFSNKTQVSQLIKVMENTFAMSLLGIDTFHTAKLHKLDFSIFSSFLFVLTFRNAQLTASESRSHLRAAQDSRQQQACMASDDSVEHMEGAWMGSNHVSGGNRRY